MKKFFSLCGFAVLLLGAGQVSGQNPFSGYKTERAAASPHVFTASAQTFLFTEGECLTSLWVKQGGGFDTLAVPALQTERAAEKTGNFTIGFNFPFAGKNMTHFGITAGGFVFFGTEDKLYPTVALSGLLERNVTDYLYFLMKISTTDLFGNASWTTRDIKAGAGARAHIERLADTLFIEFDNLQVEDNSGNLSLFSFQYAFSIDGRVSFRPVSMQPVCSGENYAFTLGLVVEDNRLFIADREGNSGSAATAAVPIGSADYPQAGECYNFIPPQACQAVENPRISVWDYAVGATGITFNPNKKMKIEGDVPSTLFVLSEKASLQGDDLPVDGTTYADGSSFGSHIFVTTGSYNDFYHRYNFRKSEAKGLNPDTRYFLYAFPYYTDCGQGPAYNTSIIPCDTFRTFLRAPAGIAVDDTKAASDSAVLNIQKEASHWLLAVDTLQLSPQISTHIDTGVRYEAGGTLTLGSGEQTRKLQVLEPYSKEDSYVMHGLNAGKAYYLYAWSVNEAKDNYSIEAASCGLRPLTPIPAVLDFASAVPEGACAPAGWRYENGNSFDFVIGKDETGTYISAQATRELTEEEDAVVPGISRVLSPIMDLSGFPAVEAEIELYYWAQNGNEIISAKPKSGDSLIVEYTDTEGQWQIIAAATSSISVKSNGSYTLSVPGFVPAERFRLRLTIRSTTAQNGTEGDNRAIPFVGIRKISLNPALPCKTVDNLQSVAEKLTSSRARLTWEDVNPTLAKSFKVSYRQSSQGNWENTLFVTQNQIDLEGLQANTAYVAEVSAVCAAGDTALARSLSFTTADCDPVSNVRTTNLRPSSVDISWKGTGEEFAVVYWSRLDESRIDTVYTDENFIELTELTPNTPYAFYIFAYCGPSHTRPNTPSATDYFKTPVECTVPTIEVLDGSITWRGVTFVTHSSVSNRQIFIETKENREDFYISYMVGNNGKDTTTVKSLYYYINTTYLAKARSLCTVDTSEWSEIVEFTTLLPPDCGTPSDLRADVSADRKSADVSWKAGENNLSWLVVHKEKTASRYDTLMVSQPRTTFLNLKPETVYVWQVQAYCDAYLYSESASAEFSGNVDTEDRLPADKPEVFLSRNLIRVDNPCHTYIRALEVFGVDGRLQARYETHSAENLFVPCSLNAGLVMVRLLGENGQIGVYKRIIP